MRFSLSISVMVLLVGTSTVADDPQPAGPNVASEKPRFSPMPFDEARDRAFSWATTVAGPEEVPQSIREIWANVEPGIPPRGTHDLVIRSFASLDDGTRQLLSTFDLRDPPVVAPDLAPLEATGDEFQRTNVMLSVARFLSEARLYDEAHTLYADVELELAVDPATALFFRAVCEHQLLMKKEGLETINTLLERVEQVPESYITVARLMRAELESLKDDSLDQVAGLMRDVERRLELARGGQKVQKKEDEITEKLDALIEEIEQQMNQSSSSSGGGNAGKSQPNNPLGESVVKGSTAPGNVDPKDVRREGDWGDLPRREREQAKNEMEKAFPSNYGRLINEYFLKRTRGDRPSDE
ncbi:MAG: hypothetical protein M3552_00720 [Planctomycetota bacterium]|nr:hypothetical protein [Planctomycetota bacterium]